MGYEPTYAINLSFVDYGFDLLGIDIREDGIYLGTDSGCSCPTPWENHTEDDFTGPLTPEQAIEEAMELWRHSSDDKHSRKHFEALVRESVGA